MSDNESTGFRKFGTGDGKITGVEPTDEAVTKTAAADGWSAEDDKNLVEELAENPPTKGEFS